MSVVRISGVGVFERITIPAPWGGDEVVQYKTISLDPPAPKVAWMTMALAIVPSFAAGMLIGINAAV